MNWNLKEAEKFYGVPSWGKPYFSVNSSGHIAVAPKGTTGPKIDLLELTLDLKERGIRSPMLIRFPDITKDRIRLLNSCFEKAITEYQYQGKYHCVYPIKVNQQRHLIDEIVSFGANHNLGLECGSKPELLVVLAMSPATDSLIVCNGFKDQEYIETALLARKLGRNTIIVVDRLEEIYLIHEASQKLNIQPRIGLRAKLNSKASGRWQDSAGARSKFGLTTSEIFTAVEFLKEKDMLDSLDLLHFHIGSQIPNIKTIKKSLKEGVQIYAELRLLGAGPIFLDVGGGLGVDYDGTGSTDSSVNYDEQEYANDVVSIIQSTCEERNVTMPNIVTEAGRSLVAHHSVLIFDVLGKNQVERPEKPPEVTDTNHKVLQELNEMYQNLSSENINESYNDLMEIQENSLQLFTFGLLTLEEKAKTEQFFWSIATRLRELVRGKEAFEDTENSLSALLSDTYFCNFSVFQSLPDCWAVGHMFPVLPIHKLLEKPTREAALVDLTCDSDGKLDQFIDVDRGEPKKTLSVHPLTNDETYYLGAFLVGAYQETLGDLHNLFGDTDAVHVVIQDNGYQVVDVVEGDTVSEVLSYVQYNLEKLTNRIRRASEKSILEGRMTKSEARVLMKYYQEGLAGYTYLEEPEGS